MAVIQFTHIGKASVAINPELVFCIESYNDGNVGAYTRIRSIGEAHVDVKESFATVIKLLASGPKLEEPPVLPESYPPITDEPSDPPGWFNPSE